MKKLTKYIEEKLLINKNFKSDASFIYKLENKEKIRIFCERWPQFNNYKDKVYINGEHVKIDNEGETIKKFNPGEYEVYIEDIDNVISCGSMFVSCKQLIYVPEFNTSKSDNFNNMFNGCINLKEVSLFDTSNGRFAFFMFGKCKKLKTVPKYDFLNCEDFDFMFDTCTILKDVPLFNMNIDKVKSMSDIFGGCENLSDDTIEEWKQIYDFTNCCKNENIN